MCRSPSVGIGIPPIGATEQEVRKTHLKNNPTYTIAIQPVGAHLQVSIPDVGIVLETGPGKIKRDDALYLAFSAISACQQK